ncbi:MAG TPA: hypothetical protein VIR59_01305 [Gaiellaceae bacterium]
MIPRPSQVKTYRTTICFGSRDFIEPFEAWRAWRVIRRGGVYSLGSIVRGTVWTPCEPLTAACLGTHLLPRLRRRRHHAAPAADCDCGIYGAPLGRIGQYVADEPCRGVARVLGRVALSGTVIECERGFRAAHSYPAQIYVPADAASRSSRSPRGHPRPRTTSRSGWPLDRLDRKFRRNALGERLGDAAADLR